MTLEELNAAAAADFLAGLNGVFEHAPWVAQRAAIRRPFATIASLHEAMMQVLLEAPEEETRAFLNGHPELAGDRLAADLTAESREEQLALGMAGTCGAADLARRNAEYRARFDFPFIICVARHTPADVLRSLDERLRRGPDEELAAAMSEVGHITRRRLMQRVEGPGVAASSGRLSCHVLDVAAGRPAQSLRVVLLQEGKVIAEVLTDGDGRSGAGLLPPGPLRQGRYELEFHAGAYFAARGAPTFYDTIPVRFVVTESEARYHIPLLLAPFGYSTYRGS